MTEYVSASELASFLQVPESPTLTQVAKLTNALIDDEWGNPVAPIPARVTSLAHNVAVRAAANPRGLSSWTRSWDDITRTERMELGQRVGVYLTDDELAELNGNVPEVRQVKSIQVRVPGWR